MTEFKFKIDRDGSFEPEAFWLRYNNPHIPTRGCPEILSGTGIAINAPRQVLFSDGPTLSPTDAQFIVCVATKFVYNTLDMGSDFMDHLTLVLVDGRTHQEYFASALLAEDSNINENLVPLRDAPEPETDHSKSLIGQFLRANVAKMIKLPAVETEYIVYASLGPYRSNTLDVKVIQRKPEPDHE
jgi:rhodanese-related sulfurtransferase